MKIVGTRNFNLFIKKTPNIFVKSIEAYSQYNENKNQLCKGNILKTDSSYEFKNGLTIDEAINYRKDILEIEGNSAKSWTFIYHIKDNV